MSSAFVPSECTVQYYCACMWTFEKEGKQDYMNEWLQLSLIGFKVIVSASFKQLAVSTVSASF